MSKPRIILYDIETSHNIAAVFQLLDKYSPIPFDNILQERAIISFAYKVLGEKRVYACSNLDLPAKGRPAFTDDKFVCRSLHAVLEGADAIIAHNGDFYDIRFAQTRMLYHGLKPLPPIPSIDTLTVARRKFLFNSNRLDYLGKFLGVGQKKSTPKGLWLKVLQGDVEAMRQMVAYNKQDVLLLERVFRKLQPYVSNHLNRRLFGEGGCPRCASCDVQSRGVHRTLSTVYRRYRCNACGGWYRAAKALPDAKSNVRVL